MPPNIFILTGAIQSGKTTALKNWCKAKQNASGMLTPVMDGKRWFLDIASNHMFAMEAEDTETSTLAVGRFVFSSTAFTKANELLLTAYANSNNSNDWLVIDEIGPLELKYQGLYEVVQKIVSQPKSNIILVVREQLVDAVYNFFGFTPIVISIKELATLDL